MTKDLVGHHLLRVRIQKRIFDKLSELAEEESYRTGEHVTVSDLVRASCHNYLILADAVSRMNNTPTDFDDDEVLVITSPML